VPTIAPYTAMLIMMYAIAPEAAVFAPFLAAAPNMKKNMLGKTRMNITVRRLRRTRRTSSLSAVRLNPPIGGT
jgi:hypothetical protein